MSGRVKIDGGLIAAKEFGEFVLEDFDDLFTRFDRFQDVCALGFFLNAGDEIFYDTEFNVGL